MITVFGAPPSRAVRVIWMLEEMGLPYEVRPVDFANRQADEAFIQASPAAMLPAIRDGAVVMAESVAIMEYLAARYGPTPLAPTVENDSFPLYQQFLHYGEASLAGPLNICIATRFYAPPEEKENWGARTSAGMVIRRTQPLVAQLGRTAYLAGDAFTCADISCAYALHLLRALGHGERLSPVLTDYWERVASRPAHGRALAHTRPLDTST